MPTPIQHLVVADVVLRRAELPPGARDLLASMRSAFLFGNTAPDVQTVSGQSREATHFFRVPLESDRPAHEAMFRAHPQLGLARRLPPAQAAFLAGYISHLLLDVMWVRDIFTPVFGPEAGWGSFSQRLFLHNVLRAWCDRRDQARLIADAGPALAATRPHTWLPFVEDRYLHRWRDVLVVQFEPGATIRTVEVFAERGRVSPEAFERILDSEDRMDEMIFCHVPRNAVEDFYARGVAVSCEIIASYLNPVERAG